MNVVNSLPHAADVDLFVVALLHSLWQATICAALLWMFLRTVSANRPRARYGVCLGAMVIVVLSMIVTWSWLDRQQMSDQAVLPVAVVLPVEGHAGELGLSNDEERKHSPMLHSAGPSNGVAGEAVRGEAVQSTITWKQWVAISWCIGTLLMLVRVVSCVVRVRGLMRHSRHLTDVNVLQIFAELKTQFAITRRAAVLVSDHINVPAVLGVVWPVLLIPPSMLSGIPAHQLRVIVAHELAHIRRYDYLVNLCQMLIESVLFFNPCVWWLSRQLRIEREACCDALAVSATGQPMDVAQTLVDFADRCTVPAVPGPQLVQAFADHNPGSLFARVRRIVLPGDPPPVRLPWHSVLGITLVCLLLMYGVERGTHTAIVAAAEWLTPPEHVEKLTGLRETHGAPATTKETPEDEKIEVAVTIRTEDGFPVPKGTRVKARISKRRGNYGYSLINDGHGRYTYLVEPGRLWIAATSQGYAPAGSGPFSCKSGEKLDVIEVILQRGFTASVRVVDSQGDAVPDAKVVAGFLADRVTLDSRRLQTDENGVVVFSHCPELPLQMDVEAKGFQFERRTVEIAKDGVVDYIVHRAKPVQGRVVSAATGEPIVDAKIHLAAQYGNDSSSRSFTPFTGYSHPPLLAMSDDTGGFTLDQFRDDCQYSLLVTADDYAPDLIQSVLAGQEELAVSLGPERFIRGKIIGPLDKLSKRRQGKQEYATFTFGNVEPVKIGDTNHCYGRRARVEIRDDIGHFLISDLLPGKVSLSLPGKTITLDPQPSIDNLTIDLSESAEPAEALLPKRTVVIRLQPPRGSADARGELRVDYIHPDHPNGYRPEWVAVQGNEVRFDVPVPTRIRYETGRLIGYWVEEESAIPVSAGDEPFVIDVPAMPAGAVYGRVLNSDGSPCEYFNLSVIVIEESSELQQKRLDTDHLSSEGEDGRFIVGPLPLGGRYRLIASHSSSKNEARLISRDFSISTQKSIHELELRFLEGITVSGHVLLSTGEPVAGVDIAMHWSSPFSHGFGGARQKTDRSGRFEFVQVNANLPGTFRLTVDPSKSFQGREDEFVPTDKPITMTIERGLQATGVLVDDASGRPIVNATIQANPSSGDARFRGEIRTRTDARGRFRFSNLEPVEYQLRIDGAVHPSVEIEQLPDGRIRYHYRSDNHDWHITGGKSKSVTIQAKRRPRSTLKVAQPSDSDPDKTK